MSRGLLVLYIIEQVQENPDQAASMLGDLALRSLADSGGDGHFLSAKDGPGPVGGDQAADHGPVPVHTGYPGDPDDHSRDSTGIHCAGRRFGQDSDELHPPGGWCDGFALTPFRFGPMSA